MAEVVENNNAQMELFDKVKKGELELMTPFKNEGIEITKLAYDFTAINGVEYAECMDSDRSPMSVYRTSYKQALSLFAKAVEKCCGAELKIDAKDVLRALGMVDAKSGAETALVFMNLCDRVRKMNF